MKVLQINAVYGHGSTGIIVRDIEAMLQKHDAESRVAYQRATGEPIGGYCVGNLLDWKLHALWTRISGKQAYASRWATGKLLRYIEAEKPDVVHLHNLHSNYIHLNMLLRYLAQKDIATVITLHDCWFFTGKCFHYVESKCDQWQSECRKCPRNKMDVRSLFFDRSNRVFKDKEKYLNNIRKLIVVGCSDWICGEARKSLLREKEIVRIYNGVDTAFFTPQTSSFREKYDLEGKFLVLGAAGKWLNPLNKDAFGQIVKGLEEQDRLVLFGCTDVQKQALEKEDKIIALDYIRDRKQMAELYAAADVFVNLTLADTLPTVNMEALSCGTPVITYDSCGSPELVDEGKTGFIVPQKDGKAVLQAIQRIKKGEISRQICRETAVCRFDKYLNYQAYLDLYMDLDSGDRS